MPKECVDASCDRMLGSLASRGISPLVVVSFLTPRDPKIHTLPISCVTYESCMIISGEKNVFIFMASGAQK